MQLSPEEPHFGPWQVAPVQAFVRLLEGTFPKTGGLKVVAIDGRSASGKTTIAKRLNQAIPASVVVSTDDVAWHHSFFDWTDLLLENVLEPARAGRGVAYRPPAWLERDREGALTVPEGCSVLILEGVGAARRELTHALDTAIWVQSDMAQARVRGIARDGGDAAIPFWDEWMTAELVFLADQEPWERADFVVIGTPELKHYPTSEVVFAVPT